MELATLKILKLMLICPIGGFVASSSVHAYQWSGRPAPYIGNVEEIGEGGLIRLSNIDLDLYFTMRDFSEGFIESEYQSENPLLIGRGLTCNKHSVRVYERPGEIVRCAFYENGRHGGSVVQYLLDVGALRDRPLRPTLDNQQSRQGRKTP